MTADEMYEQGDEFIEDYVAGRYNVVCTECNGRCVLPVADLDRCTPEQREAYEHHQEIEAEFRAERAAEIAAGC
jgi:calcineurin-like phosphoesterase family protein